MKCMLPILGLVRRELLVALRRKSNVIWLVVLLLSLLVAIAANWPPDDKFYIGRVGRESSDILRWSAFVLMAGAALVMPGLGAYALSSERDMDTYDQLRLTLLNDAGIVFGKFLSSLALYALFVVGVLPAIATAFFLTGMETFQLGAVTFCLACAAIGCYLGGMAAGALFTRSTTGSIVAYGVMLLFMGVPSWVNRAFSQFVFGTYVYPSGDSGPHFFPYSAVIASIESSTGTGWGGFIDTAVPVFVYSFFVAFWLVRFILISLKSPRTRWSATSSLSDLVKGTALPEDVTTASVPAGNPIGFPDGANPVYRRESWCEARMGWRPIPKALIVGCVFFLANAMVGMLINSDSADDRALIRVVLGVDMAGAALLLPAIVAGVFATDFQHSRLEVIRLTLLTPWDVAMGKVRLAFANAAPLLLGILCSTALPLLMVGHSANFVLWMAGVGSLLMCATLAIGLALVASAFSSKTSSAFAGAYILTFIVFAGALFVMAVIAESFWGGWRESTPLVYSASPILAYIESFRMSRVNVDNPPAWFFSDPYLTAWLRGVIVYTVLTAVCYATAMAVFLRRYGRRQ